MTRSVVEAAPDHIGIGLGPIGSLHDGLGEFASTTSRRAHDGQRLGRCDQMVTTSRHTGEDVLRHLAWHGRLDVIQNGANDLSDPSARRCPGAIGTGPVSGC